MFGNPLHLTHF